MNFTQASTSPSTIFLPPDPPESPPPGAGPPDRGSPFKGMLEGHTNARTAPAEGVKKKGPSASAAAPRADAAPQSEPTAPLIGGEATVAAGAAVAVGAAPAAPLTSIVPGASA